MKKPQYYLAYGSNLNLDQMARRCPTAEVAGKAMLIGYDLKFRGEDGFAYATVECGEGAVPALLWTLQPKDEQSLDLYEGWPRHYRKDIVEVEMDGETVEAMVYVMNDGYDLNAPSMNYLAIIAEGYQSAGFNLDYLGDAVLLSISEQRHEPTLEM